MSLQLTSTILALKTASYGLMVVEFVLASSFVLLVTLAVLAKSRVQLLPKIQLAAAALFFLSVLIGAYLNHAYVPQLLPASGKAIFLDSFLYDASSISYKALVLISLLLLGVMVSLDPYLEPKYRVDAYAVLAFSGVGACMLLSSHNFLTSFLCIESLSISLYLLAGFFNRKKHTNAISGIYRYLISTLVLTFFFLCAVAILYGYTQTFDYGGALAILHVLSPFDFYVLVSLLFAVLFFKLFTFPFNFFAPDIYQASSFTGIVFLSTIIKVVFLLFFCHLGTFIPLSLRQPIYLITFIAACTGLLFAGFVAIRQKNVKRLLGYISVLDTGFLLALITGSLAFYNVLPQQDLYYYLLVYVLAFTGLCAVLTSFPRLYDTTYDFEDFSGQAFRRPYLTALLLIFILSLIGLPPTSGFLAKTFLLINFIYRVPAPVLISFSLIFLLSTILSVVYYLRLLAYMLKKPSYCVSLPCEPLGQQRRALLNSILAILIIVLLIYPFA